MFKMELESGIRRIYRTGSGALAVEVSITDHTVIRGGAMDVFVKNGQVPHFMDRTLAVQTYFKLPDGSSIGELFNPTVKHVGARTEADFDWMLEATPENERLLLDEISRRYLAWVELLASDLEENLVERGCDDADR